MLRRNERVSLGLICLGLCLRIAGYPFVSADVRIWVEPWYLDICTHGFSALATGFSNYSPPYLYLLWLSSKVFGPTQSLLAIKCVGAVSDVALCGATAVLVTRSTRSVSFWQAYAIVWCLPTVVVNSSVWGQCDAFYTTFIVAAFAALMGSTPLLGLCLFGIAVGIKLQAMLLAPAIALLLIAGRLPWKFVPAAIICYCVSLIPAAFAGRPWGELLGVYVEQYNMPGVYRSLSLEAPNLWTLAKHVPQIRDNYNISVTLGLLATAAAGIVYLAIGRKRLLGSSRNTILEIAFVSAFIFPFLLPKMHERYFFVADVLSVALALVDRRWLTVAVLVQIGSLMAYAPFLLGLSAPLLLGIVANTLAFFVILVFWYPRTERYLPTWLRNMFSRVAKHAGSHSVDADY